jgi:IS30 family transposase
MLFAIYGQAVLVVHDRRSRLAMAARQGKSAQETCRHISQIMAPLPPSHRRSIIFDNGTEFAHHQKLKEQIGLQSFFCDLRSPWQKDGVENAILRLRRYLSRKTNLKTITQKEFDTVIWTYNHTPRKCLDYKTLTEVFLSQMQPLHFNRKSTPQPSQE